MGAFSQEMAQVVIDLTKELGNPCTLTKVVKGTYNPTTGETPPSSVQTINTFSAPASYLSQMFSRDGENTNLDGFDDAAVIIPFFAGIDKGWLYDNQNILTLGPLKTQGQIVAYNITVGIKE